MDIYVVGENSSSRSVPIVPRVLLPGSFIIAEWRVKHILEGGSVCVFTMEKIDEHRTFARVTQSENGFCDVFVQADTADRFDILQKAVDEMVGINRILIECP